MKDFVDHIDYIVKKIGIDHVGISSDFDGGGGIDGWNDASETFNVTLELVRRGYTEEQIGKIWSGNLLRVLEQVQNARAEEVRGYCFTSLTISPRITSTAAPSRPQKSGSGMNSFADDAAGPEPPAALTTVAPRRP